MTYYESAEDAYVSWERVLREMRDHGIDEGSIEWIEANRLFNNGQAVKAQDLLEWLGY